ncbi:MAG TPA: O-methyltransferase [Ktedonobacteraceae bacterium]|jgi:caffeoyl-CoA O-methyltransferase|nr:O-methyltransferase [Ktedonobacteraceae bacterium]
MTNDSQALNALQEQQQIRTGIEQTITRLFAPEDKGLCQALSAAKEAELPEIQISPIQGKLLQFLAVACNAHKILEIGSLAGYSGIWLARALPAGGRLITLEINPRHAEVVRNSFANAGVSDRTEVRVGAALDTLPQLTNDGPFDLIFIDADKPSYPHYFEWAMRLARPGSIIVADNCIRRGKALQESTTAQDEGTTGLINYNKQVRSDPRLTSLALAMDEDYTDGFTIAVVKPESEHKV